ncbi:hypothetical protein B0T24DRAFT_681845 [Lasiosphaeria ovina]|uniref:Uncharacterized protein n=1 Tax=Lasiosphaeria ovina TaxID=92902 RepID=A0AAE0JZ72_9PEZI|nr:hypothetical protein B0T24DRAFT_681845 [Lasiosphaeria ovina]
MENTTVNAFSGLWKVLTASTPLTRAAGLHGRHMGVYARNHALAGARAKALEGTRDHAAAAALVTAIDRAAGETAVLTCATDGTIVEVFAHYFEREQYHQCHVANESLLAYPNRGRELLRNAQDYARRKSYELAALLGANLQGAGHVVGAPRLEQDVTSFSSKERDNCGGEIGGGNRAVLESVGVCLGRWPYMAVLVGFCFDLLNGLCVV